LQPVRRPLASTEKEEKMRWGCFRWRRIGRSRV